MNDHVTNLKYINSDIELDGDLAEFTGIMLGDGRLENAVFKRKRPPFNFRSYKISITINRQDAIYGQFIMKIFNRIFGVSLKEARHEKNALVYYCYSREAVKFLEKNVMMSNNKVKNQVGIPSWIFSDIDLMKRCFAGLIDTDGSYYKKTNDGLYCINLRNRSVRLLKDFRRMCIMLGVSPSKTTEGVQICRQKDIKLLGEIIQFHRIKARL